MAKKVGENKWRKKWRIKCQIDFDIPLVFARFVQIVQRRRKEKETMGGESDLGDSANLAAPTRLLTLWPMYYSAAQCVQCIILHCGQCIILRIMYNV